MNIMEGFQYQTKGFVSNSANNREAPKMFRKTQQSGKPTVCCSHCRCVTRSGWHFRKRYCVERKEETLE